MIKSYEELRHKEGDAQSNTNTKMCTDEDENTVAGVQADGGDGGGQSSLGQSFWGCNALWCEKCKCQMGWYLCVHGRGLPPLDGSKPLGAPPWEEGIYITEEGEILPIDPEGRKAELRRMPSDDKNEDPEEGSYIIEEGERWILPIDCLLYTSPSPRD